MLELYSTNQIPFCHFRLRSITRHFLVKKNCILSRILTALSNTTKKIHRKLYATDSEFYTHSPASWLFLRLKFAFGYLGINPVACKFLVNNLHFIAYFTHRGQSSVRQQPIKQPSLKYYPLLLLSVLPSYEMSLVRVYWRYNNFSLLFPVKLPGIKFLRWLTVGE